MTSFVVGDMHFDEASIEECFNIIIEIVSIKRHHYKECDTIIFLGDICDKNKLNAYELFKLTELFDLVREYFEHIVIVEGNHDTLDNKTSIIDFLQFANIQVSKKPYVYDNFLFGHFFVDKSNSAFGKHTFGVEELTECYDGFVLGHQHDYQQFNENSCHLGSIRYVDFGENSDIPKYFGIFHDKKLKLQALQSTIKMYNVSDLDTLRQIDSKSKVRYIFKSLEQLKKEINVIQEERKRFFQFKTKNDFLTSQKIEVTQGIDYKSCIYQWLEQLKDNDIKGFLTPIVQKELT